MFIVFLYSALPDEMPHPLKKDSWSALIYGGKSSWVLDNLKNISLWAERVLPVLNSSTLCILGSFV